jgi:hypothetical protein
MNNLTFTIDLVNGLLQYLGSRPYIETAGLIAEMHKQASDQGAPAPVAVSIENSAE